MGTARANMASVERRIKLTIAYLGTGFHGWQRQKGQRSVQGELESALARVTGRPAPAVTGAGRTDAGVHARGQVAHVDLPTGLPIRQLPSILNASLPEGIRVLRAVAVRPSFHARRDAVAKHYAYRLHRGEARLPWAALRSAPMPAVVDRRILESALALLVGRHDMASFSVPDPTQGPTTKRLLAAWAHWGRLSLTLHFLGEGFLRYQVRRMTGALLSAAGERSTSRLERLLSHPSPGAPIATAPARGLTLERVYYRQPRRFGRSDLAG